MISSADSSTPAARASALTQPRDPTPPSGDDDDGGPKRHPLRTVLVLVILAVVFGGGLYAFWRYTQAQYYVGVTGDGTVAIFKGIPAQIAGLHLSSVDKLSTANIDELTPVAQKLVREGIQSGSEQEAQEQLDNLLDPDNMNLLPACPTAAPPATVDPSASASSPSDTPAPTTDILLPTGPPDCRPGTN
jgi:protein phosphatase